MKKIFVNFKTNIKQKNVLKQPVATNFYTNKAFTSVKYIMCLH